MIIHNPVITGSFQINGSNISSVESIDNVSSSVVLLNDASASFSDRVSTAEGSITSLNSASSSYLLNTTDTLDGDLTVTGKITAQEFHTEFVSASILYDSGSTQFGNTSDDTHTFSGSLIVSGSSHNIKGGLMLGHSTATAQGDLHVFGGEIYLGNTEFNSGIKLTGGTSGLQITNQDEFGSADLVKVNMNGNVGIGTTSPQAKLHVNAGAVSTPRGGGFTKFFFTGDNATTTYLELQTPSGSTGDILFSDASSGDYGIVGYNHANDSMYFYTNSSPRLLINSSGNVGIGTNNPTEKLHIVDGRLNFDKENTSSGGDYDFIKIGYNGSWSQNDNGLAGIEVNDGGGTVGKFGIAYAGGSGGYFVVKNLYNDSGYAGSNEVFKVNGFGLGYFSGKLGIGTSPSVNLHVNQPNHNEDTAGYADATILWRLRNETVTGTATGRLNLYSGGSTTINIEGSPSRATYFNAGNVGIGTNSPTKTLDVNGPIRTRGGGGFNLADGTTQVGALVMHKEITGAGSDNSSVLFAETGLDIHFMTNGSASTKAIINTDGNVGIGTNNPSSKLHINGASAHIQFTGTNNRITFSGYRALEGSHTGALLQLGEGYSTTVLYNNVGIATTTTTSGFNLDVNGPVKGDYFSSNTNTTISGLGPYEWTKLGPSDASAPRATAVQIGDIAGAKYAIAGGGYDLAFYKHVSAPDSFTRAFYISGTSSADTEPNVVIDNKLFNNGKYYYSDGGLLLKKMVTVSSDTTTTLLTIDSNGSYSCIGGGELLIVFVDVGSPWGVYVWKGLLTMRTVQFGSMYSSGIQEISSRNNLDGTFTVSSSTSKTGGVADGKLIVTATTSSGIAGTAHVSFNGWTTGGAQPY